MPTMSSFHCHDYPDFFKTLVLIYALLPYNTFLNLKKMEVLAFEKKNHGRIIILIMFPCFLGPWSGNLQIMLAKWWPLQWWQSNFAHWSFRIENYFLIPVVYKYHTQAIITYSLFFFSETFIPFFLVNSFGYVDFSF